MSETRATYEAGAVQDSYAPWWDNDLKLSWDCSYCRSLSSDDEPQDADHAPDCPWLVARQLVQP